MVTMLNYWKHLHFLEIQNLNLGYYEVENVKSTFTITQRNFKLCIMTNTEDR